MIVVWYAQVPCVFDTDQACSDLFAIPYHDQRERLLKFSLVG